MIPCLYVGTLVGENHVSLDRWDMWHTREGNCVQNFGEST
jgi:hypothetical protein